MDWFIAPQALGEELARLAQQVTENDLPRKAKGLSPTDFITEALMWNRELEIDWHGEQNDTDQCAELFPTVWVNPHVRSNPGSLQTTSNVESGFSRHASTDWGEASLRIFGNPTRYWTLPTSMGKEWHIYLYIIIYHLSHTRMHILCIDIFIYSMYIYNYIHTLHVHIGHDIHRIYTEICNNRTTDT